MSSTLPTQSDFAECYRCRRAVPVDELDVDTGYCETCMQEVYEDEGIEP